MQIPVRVQDAGRRLKSSLDSPPLHRAPEKRVWQTPGPLSRSALRSTSMDESMEFA